MCFQDKEQTLYLKHNSDVLVRYEKLCFSKKKKKKKKIRRVAKVKKKTQHLKNSSDVLVRYEKNFRI
jgi:hypothetical protein